MLPFLLTFQNREIILLEPEYKHILNSDHTKETNLKKPMPAVFTVRLCQVKTFNTCWVPFQILTK